MKKIIAIAVMLFALLSSCSAGRKASWATETPENLIIYYDAEAGSGELLKAAKKYGSKVIYEYRNINGVALTVPKGKTTDEAKRHYEKVPGVLSVTEDRKMQLD